MHLYLMLFVTVLVLFRMVVDPDNSLLDVMLLIVPKFLPEIFRANEFYPAVSWNVLLLQILVVHSFALVSWVVYPQLLECSESTKKYGCVLVT